MVGKSRSSRFCPMKGRRGSRCSINALQCNAMQCTTWVIGKVLLLQMLARSNITDDFPNTPRMHQYRNSGPGHPTPWIFIQSQMNLQNIFNLERYTPSALLYRILVPQDLTLRPMVMVVQTYDAFTDKLDTSEMPIAANVCLYILPARVSATLPCMI